MFVDHTAERKALFKIDKLSEETGVGNAECTLAAAFYHTAIKRVERECEMFHVSFSTFRKNDEKSKLVGQCRLTRKRLKCLANVFFILAHL